MKKKSGLKTPPTRNARRIDNPEKKGMEWVYSFDVLGTTLNCPVYAKVDGKLHLDSN